MANTVTTKSCSCAEFDCKSIIKQKSFQNNCSFVIRKN